MADSKYPRYIDFYREQYSEFMIDTRLTGGNEGVGMFMAGQPPGLYPDQPLDTYNLQLGVGGVADCEVDAGDGWQSMTLPAGSFVLSPPDTAVDYRLHDDVVLMCLGIPREYIEIAAEEIGVDSSTLDKLLQSTNSDTVVRQIVRECWSEGRASNPNGSLFVDSNMLTLAARLLKVAAKAKHQGDVTPSHLEDNVFEQLLEFIEAHIDEPIPLKSLARVANMSDYQFAKAIRVKTGLSPHQWIISRRLEKAQTLLADGSLPLSEIALMSGFSSQAHMTSMFTQKIGVTPSEVRKRSSLSLD